jgi:co-chaperonin GroES (HSP10)
MKKALKGEPLFARVVLERPRVEKIGSIILPDQVAKKNTPCEGVVLQVGDGCDDRIKKHVGKKVLFAQYAGAWTKIGDEEYFFCQDEDILYLMED